MAAPVTGPFYKYPSAPFTDGYQRSYKQAKPYDRPLEYKMYRVYGLSSSVDYDANTGQASSSSGKDATFQLTNSVADYASRKAHAYNAAYERLRSKLSDTAGWAENLAQINKTRTSIIQRSVQLATFSSHLRHGRFEAAARVLRTAVPSRVSNRKAASQNFLEWEYGIKPLLSDLETSMKILTSSPDPAYISGKGRDSWSNTATTSGSTNTYVFYQNVTVTGSIEVQLRTRYTITNPNLFLANQLGLIDIALPWKLIPFSFVVDWFINVEQVLSSVTDWYGVSLQYPHETHFRVGTRNLTRESSGRTFTNRPWSHATINTRQVSVELDRVMGISKPTLTVKPFKGFSVQRGAQAIALVLSVLGK